MNVRFTAWISEAERDALDKVANDENTSVNFIVRTAIRRHPKVSRLLHVTSETANTENGERA